MKKIIYLFAISALLFTACKKKANNTNVPGEKPVVPTKYVPAPYKIIEDFETGVKAAYAAGNVILKTGNWTMDDALLGQLTTDVKNGLQVIRLRTGQLSMNFDVDSISTFKFSHAKFGSDAASVINVWMSSDQGTTYAKLGSDINVNSTTFVTDSFKITGNKKVRFQIRNAGTNRVNIDDVTFIGAGNPNITFTNVVDVEPPVPAPDVPGASRDKPSGTGPDVPPANGDNSNLLFGNPSNATENVLFSDNYLIDFKYFIVSYSSTRATPNWVSWHLDETSSTNATPRLDNWAAYSGLPAGFYQVQSTSYSGSGFDRGHNCPSADRTSSVDANSATFLMPNIIPQAPNNNQKTWNNLESDLRTEVQKGNEVYIIMGSYGKGGVGSAGSAETINNGRITVPNRVWKVAVILTKGNGDLARVTESTRIIAIDTPNDQTINSDWKTYITTIDAIEAATNYNLLSALPVSLQATIEAKKYIP